MYSRKTFKLNHKFRWMDDDDDQQNSHNNKEVVAKSRNEIILL